MSEPEIVIVGAGFGGIGTAIELRRAGFEDFVILEKSAEVGGTWWENTYPGCACDVMSLLYSFSYAPNREWTRLFARQHEILDYLRRTVDRFGLRERVWLRSEVTTLDFDDDADRWEVRLADGTRFRPRFVVLAAGPLHVPAVPDIPGRDTFGGTSFHSARWDHDFDPAGRRIAVIGTGASAVQFVPQIARDAARVSVFQRTPHWVIPKPDRALSAWERRMFRLVPGTQRLYRWVTYWGYESSIVGFLRPEVMRRFEFLARGHLRRQVRDPELRRRLTPAYRLGCKRILVSDDYYPALQRDNVELVTESIERIDHTGITTADGAHREFDAIVYGTGFQVADRFAGQHVVGANGRSLRDVWRGGMEAFLGVAVHGFPNLFLVMGPNSGGGNQSIVFMIEAQARYIRQCLELARRTGTTRVEVRAGTQHEFNRRIQAKLAGTVWNAGGCDSWYLDEHGVNRAAWPGSSVSYWRTLRHPKPGHFDLTVPAEREPAHAYSGPAVLDAPGLELPVTVTLGGYPDPIDGRYHWYGRITATPDADLPDPGRARVYLALPGREPVPARLEERDPWGNLRIAGTGEPPFPLEPVAADHL
ncbi:FAD-dependent oxidoreductase [Nocardia sp. CC227C]|uniref:FAD-dependent oxidoreductase n=1 Tax=Nocardia sp. CC227C TaxID=3044562 RepID=UPI00278C2CBE|nr:FAD-dependent oxidoreductase [Nocardia sp. CC227C]